MRREHPRQPFATAAEAIEAAKDYAWPALWVSSDGHTVWLEAFSTEAQRQAWIDAYGEDYKPMIPLDD
jgi:hypothetical protein